MRPTLRPGDLLLGRRADPDRLRAGQIVVLAGPPISVKRLARRAAAGWWVLGDDPAASTDSRAYGPVPAQRVLAVVLCRLG